MGRESPTREGPRDLSPTAYNAFVVLGGCNLIPWMTFLSLADYFSTTYRTNAMEFAFPATSTTTLVITSGIVMAYGHLLPFSVRIPVPTFIVGVLMMAVPVLDLLMGAGLLSLDAAYRMTLVVVFFNTVGCATAQNSMYALGGVSGDNATQALQTGSGIIGVVAVGMRGLTKLGVPDKLSMWIFCSMGSLLLLLSLISYHVIMRDPQARPVPRPRPAPSASLWPLVPLVPPAFGRKAA